MKRRNLLLVLLALALPLLACGGVDDAATAEAEKRYRRCVRGCTDAGMQFAGYKHDPDGPDCLCVYQGQVIPWW